MYIELLPFGLQSPVTRKCLQLYCFRILLKGKRWHQAIASGQKLGGGVGLKFPAFINFIFPLRQMFLICVGWWMGRSAGVVQRLKSATHPPPPPRLAVSRGLCGIWLVICCAL